MRTKLNISYSILLMALYFFHSQNNWICVLKKILAVTFYIIASFTEWPDGWKIKNLQKVNYPYLAQSLIFQPVRPQNHLSRKNQLL